MSRRVCRTGLALLAAALVLFAGWLTLDDGWDVYAAMLMVFAGASIATWLDSGEGE